MSKKRSAGQKKAQRARKRLREAYMSPEIKQSFKAINIWIDRLLMSHEQKKEEGCAKVRGRRRKLIMLSERQNHRCCYCGCDTWHPDIIDYKTDRSKSNKATLEHLLPTSQGGTFSWDNLVMACSECNTARGDIPFEDFLKSIQKLNLKKKKNVVVEISNEKRLKEEKSNRRRFQLFMTASWMFPEDYKYLMENATLRDARIVFKGSKDPSAQRNALMNRIRGRVEINRMAA